MYSIIIIHSVGNGKKYMLFFYPKEMNEIACNTYTFVWSEHDIILFFHLYLLLTFTCMWTVISYVIIAYYVAIYYGVKNKSFEKCKSVYNI